MPPSRLLKDARLVVVSEISARFEWKADALHLIDGAESDLHLRVADSFLVRDGIALAVDLHRERFVESALEAGYDDPGAIKRFWNDSLAIIPSEIEWFPRFELARSDSEWRLSFLLRSAPILRDSVVLATYRGPDLRSSPRIKGPDIESLLRLRSQVNEQGADEAVLLDNNIFVVDGSTSAIMWWRGDTLCTPPSELQRVQSITAASILTVASALGVEIVPEAVEPYELSGADVWAVNSLHGIRSVSGWIDGPDVLPNPTRAMQWRRRLRSLARPVVSS
jgi:branched-subunit amino acid aminotransferase/4-amino-4-deoxychorismate lyase